MFWDDGAAMRDLVNEIAPPGEGAPPVHAPAGAASDRFINRELSLLDFNARVLAVAADSTQPLLERVRFLAIFGHNLDEFFQVRVGALRAQQAVSLSGGWLRAGELLAAIRERVDDLIRWQNRLLRDELLPALRRERIAVMPWAELDDAARQHLDTVFEEQIFPVLTPLAVDPAHPFPYISNLSLNLMVVVNGADTSSRRIARIKVPPLFPRFLALPDGERLVPIEQVISAHLPRLFAGSEVLTCHVFRVTRNADFQLEEETDDLLEAVQDILHRRRRSPEALRLEVDRTATPEVVSILTRELELNEADVYVSDGLLDMSSLFELARADRPDLKSPHWTAVVPPQLAPATPGEPVDIFAAMRRAPILVQHPYDSFEESVGAFIEQAAADPHVLAIKQSLYRTSGPVSLIVRALVHAAETGKQVVALIELTARFDEQANIGWAQMLERAGVHVVYGIVGMKTHCKVTLVVREEQGSIRRYFHIGTGNYNPDTARMYEDVGLLSADRQLGADLSELFNMLTGYSRQRYRKLLVAPGGLRQGLLQLIAQESAKEDGLITIKVNSLTDQEMIEALYAASGAGTRIELIVRGMCSLRPGVPGMSERITVRSIVGQYLEHSRIFRFGADTAHAQYYIGSADLMVRNLDQRVEVVTPVVGEPLRRRLREILEVCLSDDVLAWELHADGRWTRVPTVRGVAAQERLKELALQRARS
jgi:polyphosphate kinase